MPLESKSCIHVEHYNYENALLRMIEGPSARAIFLRIIAEGWVSELSHAAYIGKELAKAELSLQHHLIYTQDGA